MRFASQILVLTSLLAFPVIAPSGYAQSSADYNEPSLTKRASVDVPLESWTYSAIERLASLGYVDSAFLGIRPWTRAEFAQLIDEADAAASERDTPLVIAELLSSLHKEFAGELNDSLGARFLRLNSVYARTEAISGEPLTESFHFGQTITNDYGRPFGEGFNQVVGVDASAALGRFAFRIRSELQHAPGLPALPDSARQAVAAADGLPEQPAIDTSTRNRLALLDATAAVELGGIQVSVGKQSLWWGTGRSGAMALSNNAEPIYMLRVAQSRPIQLPSFLAYLGLIRIDAFFGHLEDHQFPPSPFFYGQKISVKPTPNLEFGFSRTVVFAGRGVTPLTFGNFFHSFFSFSSGTAAGFDLRTNPGARHSAFDFSYRLPHLRPWGVVLYTDSIVHDDVSPIAAPRRAAINPGIFFARVPETQRLSFRAEAISTDPPVSRSNGGKFIYWESIYRDGYTNGGNLLGSWIGREGKGGQAWLTYHRTPESYMELSYRRSKLAKDFIEGGGTQNDIDAAACWRLRPSVQADLTVQYEHWRIPALSEAQHTDISIGLQFEWLNAKTTP